mmetsp:Transcript_24736/g.38099  ORF Transcript_24736/g.38099 Transcript_24736/m.38099 type:complete len:84 (+) Transcript_24736:647-898(+)
MDSRNQEHGTIIEGTMGVVHGLITTQTAHQAELYGMTAAYEYFRLICNYYTIQESTTTIHSVCDNEECMKKTAKAKEPLTGVA